MKYVVADEIIYIKKEKFVMLYHRKLHKYFKLSFTMANFLINFIRAIDVDKLTESEQKMAKSLIELQIVIPSYSGRKSICKVRELVGKHPLNIIQLEITKRCNFNCIHCYLGNDRQVFNQDMKKEDVFKIIDEASKMGVFEFNITGGEPLLHPDMEEILVHIYESGMRTRIYTNGYLINDRWIELFKKLDIYRIRISVDGIDPKTHDGIRGVKGFSIIQNNIDKLTHNGIEVEITTTLMRDNLSDIHDLINKFENKDRIYHITDVYISENKNDVLKITEVEYVNAIKERFENWSYCDRYGKGEKSHCGIANDFLFIASDGVGKLCPTLPLSYDLDNVITEGLETVWKTMIDRYYGKAVCNKNNDCKYSELCNGGCRSRALYHNGSIESKDTYICNLYEYLVNRE
jgi:radical SAM protein with 4Fe4S-binding SPASM domain